MYSFYFSQTLAIPSPLSGSKTLNTLDMYLTWTHTDFLLCKVLESHPWCVCMCGFVYL